MTQDITEEVDIIPTLAQAAHEMNRVLQLASGDPEPSPHWEDSPQWQKDSAIEGVAHALDGKTPEELHAKWTDHKLNDGWNWGPVKDAEKKEHPCLTTYSDLPQYQKNKDVAFYGVVELLRDLL